MRLRNKKTGEIGNLLPYGCEDGKMWVWIGNISRPEYRYSSLAELNDEWEDYEEPKEHWGITSFGDVEKVSTAFSKEMRDEMREIDNYFETKEEAERAVEKLKAWKRLKDNGFKFTGFEETDRGCLGDFTIYCYTKPDYTRPYNDVEDDLDLLFGGEE